jgi:hypothetical protein
MNLTQITLNYLNAKQALENAEKAKAQAEADLKLAYAEKGLNFNVVDGQKVLIVNGERPKYNLKALTELVSPIVLKQVTKLEVDGKKFKSAVELGVIPSDIAEAITTVTKYDQVRVTEVASETENVVNISQVA